MALPWLQSKGRKPCCALSFSAPKKPLRERLAASFASSNPPPRFLGAHRKACAAPPHPSALIQPCTDQAHNRPPDGTPKEGAQAARPDLKKPNKLWLTRAQAHRRAADNPPTT